MKKILTLLFMFCFLSLTASTWCAQLLIVADEWPQMKVLGKFLEEKGKYEITMVEQEKMPEDLSNYEAIFQFIHSDMHDQTAAALIDYTNAGGRLVVLHHGISSKKKKTKGWYEFLGVNLDMSENAHFRYEWLKPVPFTLVNLRPGHYITSHNVNYTHTVQYRSSDEPSEMIELPAMNFEGSEVFINHQFTDGREKTVFLGFLFEDQRTGKTVMQDRSGWYKKAGDGILFYIHPGDVPSDFENRDYCQIILNSLHYKP